MGEKRSIWFSRESRGCGCKRERRKTLMGTKAKRPAEKQATGEGRRKKVRNKSINRNNIDRGMRHRVPFHPRRKTIGKTRKPELGKQVRNRAEQSRAEVETRKDNKVI